ncbi:4-amino-4-deoxy-L-arabinose-phosphoundecaprenol flippase subunit ArnF [Pseudomonas sp. dw_358]|uniref:4-amino-4-deoxy-L-arabinose-phosphoundecaprenol flippase subunit ArnF n=1 Tax=Pseudomonas sp. dw_358 TaxID=2720083 RepID=UPI001BD60012|nr:4-amino-4-deoxy-L-arabinose-phosphoundecaprenol flippase subunit ArnF [Pseudomonas sp. dw_358]
MSRTTAISLAMGSVVLVSSAQLGMRWSMSRLPGPSEWLAALSQGSLSMLALGVVAAAIIAYALSMLCWLGALRELPLGRAYAMLSMSYALVYVAAACLPTFNEHFSLLRTLGVTLVILGVLIINSRRPQGVES